MTTFEGFKVAEGIIDADGGQDVYYSVLYLQHANTDRSVPFRKFMRRRRAPRSAQAPLGDRMHFARAEKNSFRTEAFRTVGNFVLNKCLSMNVPGRITRRRERTLVFVRALYETTGNSGTEQKWND